MKDDLRRKAGKDFLQIRSYVNEDGSELPVLKFETLEQYSFLEHCYSLRDGGE